MAIKKSFLISTILSMLIVSSFLIAAEQDLGATIIISLAGDKDSLGTGVLLGDPVAPAYAVNDLSDGTAFDQRRSGLIEWTHQFDIPISNSIISASITLLTFDIEDAGAGDGQGGEPYDTRFYIDGIEVVGAFDDVYTADYSSDQLIPPNWVTFNLVQSFFPFMQDGLIYIQMADLQGGDNVWIDFSELRIETTAAPVPEPSAMLTFVTGIIMIGSYARRRFWQN